MGGIFAGETPIAASVLGYTLLTGLFLVALVIGYQRRLGMYDRTEALARSLLAAFIFGWVIGPYYLWLLWKAQRAQASGGGESGR